jgi:gluconokinase
MTMAFTTCSSHSRSTLSYGIGNKPVKASLGFKGQDLGPVIVMGVSGSGKTTLGTALAKHLGIEFIEGDSLHPAENIAKMSAGTPLTDEDRWPWLANIARATSAKPDSVVSCSALKRVYRDRLREGIGPQLRFICLMVSRAELERRMTARRGHFMPPGLLDSQLAALEPPLAEADALVLDGTEPPASNAARAVAWLQTGRCN